MNSGDEFKACFIGNNTRLFSDDEFKKYFKTIEEIREEKLNKLIK